MRKLLLLIVLVISAVLLSAPASASGCAPTCTCQASYGGGICHADCGPCPNGLCAWCSCTSDNGCLFACRPAGNGGGGGGGGACANWNHCVLWVEGDAVTVTGIMGLVRKVVPPGWTVEMVGEDDGTRATFGGEWALDDLLRIHYGRRLMVDEGRKVAKIER